MHSNERRILSNNLRGYGPPPVLDRALYLIWRISSPPPLPPEFSHDTLQASCGGHCPGRCFHESCPRQRHPYGRCCHHCPTARTAADRPRPAEEPDGSTGDSQG